MSYKLFFLIKYNGRPSVAEPEQVGAGTFLSEPEPVRMSGSDSTLDETEKILNDILFVRFNIDVIDVIKKQILYLTINDFFS